MILQELSQGTVIETEKFVAFFGKKNSEVAKLHELFPQFHLRRIKQVHGNAVVESSSKDNDFDKTADAHFTSESGLGLCVITADCIPVLIYCSSPQMVCGIHAGWRGVANRIIPTAIHQLLSLGARAEDLSILIGPHIQQNSFEVDRPVEEELLRAANVQAQDVVKRVGEKSHIDLRGIVFAQLAEFDISPEQVKALFIDTKSNSDYHSFRRDRENSGRQVSFIVAK